MEELEILPEVVSGIQKYLKPYIKQRQQAAHIRRILAAHLGSCVDTNEHQIPRPLSLVCASCSIEASKHGARGIYRDYLRCIRSNVTARREYAQISKTHRATSQDHDSVVRGTDAPGDPLKTFLDLVKKKQKHEVLCIIQDYVDMLGRKPNTTADYLDPAEVLKGLGALPQIPSEVLSVSGGQRRHNGADLKVLLDQLEKSVLKAKLLLKREQKLLAKVRSKHALPHLGEVTKVQALGTTRNELIDWIETELAGAGESPELEDEDVNSSRTDKNESRDSELASIHRQYSLYTKARQSLVTTAAGSLQAQPNAAPHEEDDLFPSTDAPDDAHDVEKHLSYPSLEDLVAVSNQQKAINQQKAYLTINLAKQLKDSAQSLERLAHESHLLPAHPIPISSSPQKANASSLSFGEEILRQEKLDSSRGVRAWVYASEAAANSAKETILEKLEGGSVAIDESRKMLLELQNLLGDNTQFSTGKDQHRLNELDIGKLKDIWTMLDGSLGVIKYTDRATDSEIGGR